MDGTRSYGLRANVAVTVVRPFKWIVHVVADAKGQPCQPVNDEPSVGRAVRMTVVPLGNRGAQTPPHRMLVEPMATTPRPAPPVRTVRRESRERSKRAATVLAALIVTVHVGPDAAAQPLHLMNVEPAPAEAVRVTTAPLS